MTRQQLLTRTGWMVALAVFPLSLWLTRHPVSPALLTGLGVVAIALAIGVWFVPRDGAPRWSVLVLSAATACLGLSLIGVIEMPPGAAAVIAAAGGAVFVAWAAVARKRSA